MWFTKLLDFCLKWEGEGNDSRLVIAMPHHKMECLLTVKQVARTSLPLVFVLIVVFLFIP